MAPKSNSVTPTANGNAQPLKPFQIMCRAMSNDATIDNDEYTGDDLNAILEAETEADVWKAVDRVPFNFQHLAGCEIQVLNLQVKYSRGSNGNNIRSPFISPDGKQMYLLVSVVRISDAMAGKNKGLINLPPVGEVFVANTSAKYVVAQLWRFLTMGLIDEATGASLACSVEETDLGDGQAVIKLRQLSQRPIPARAE